MLFSRTPSGLAAEHLFYSEILVYVEGKTDIPFYNAVLQNYDCRIRTPGGGEECQKLAEALIEKDLPYAVILDGHYGILTRARSKHRRVILLHRHSYENYLFEEEPIKQFCRERIHSEDSLEEVLANGEFADFIGNIEVKFKDLLILDVAHQSAGTGYDVLPNKSDRFFKPQTSVDFLDSQIQQSCTEAANRIDSKSVDNIRISVEKFLRGSRLVDLLPGHFAFGIIRRLIIDTINRKIRKSPNISNDDIRLYLSTVVWRLVKTRDHNSLKRRLRSAVREAKKIRQADSNQTQPNTCS